MNSIISDIVNLLNGMNTFAVWIIMLLVCFSAVVLFYRFFGKTGIYVYIVISVIAANLQVLKSTTFFFSPDPVALGTLMFATGYLCTDILSEYHGKAEARKAVYLGFASYLLWCVVMVLTLGYTPLTAETAGENMAWNIPFHGAMQMLFEPSPTFFIAGMSAFLISQFNDIWLFSKIREKTGKKHLWFRNTASTSVSALVDNIVFSVLAWVVLADSALPWDVVIFTFILGTYAMRIVISILDTPFIYWAGKIKPKE